MKAGDCFRFSKGVILRYCRKTSVGLHMFVAINVNNGDVYGKMLKEESIPYLKPLSKVIFDRIAKKC